MIPNFLVYISVEGTDEINPLVSFQLRSFVFFFSTTVMNANFIKPTENKKRLNIDSSTTLSCVEKSLKQHPFNIINNVLICCKT